MDWLVFVEIALATVALAYAVYRVIVAVKEAKLLPTILKAIEEAELQYGMSGEEKLNYALDYIKREATTTGISVDIARTIKLINTIVSLTKKVNFK